MVAANPSPALQRMLARSFPDLSPEAANLLLSISFGDEERQRLATLLQKNGAGTLTSDEREELDYLNRLGIIVDILHARARRALNQGSKR